MNIPTLVKPYHYDGGNKYSEKDRNIIKEICNKNK